MNEKISIVIVDSGVKKTNDYIQGYSFSEKGISENFEDEYGHGTAIYSIIKKVNDFSNITNIKLDNIENGADGFLLEELLKYIYEKEKADIINLSLGVGVCDNLTSLQAIVDKISLDGTIIVSAFDNSGAISYPAAFDNVIGVINGYHCSRIDDFEYVDDTVVNVAAKGNVQRVSWTTPDYIMIGGNSFACAHVTVQIAKFMHDGFKTKEEILNKFKEISKTQHISREFSLESNLLFEMNKAVLFPFNKEMHSLVRYSDMLPFTIESIYDVKYSGTIGATTTHLMKDSGVKEITIRNIRDIEWNLFDTLILGHTSTLSALIEKDNVQREVIEEALKHEKKVYSFDDLTKLGYENGENIFFPRIDSTNLPPNRFGMLYRISKPVVGIFGTSSAQGKFTLQLKLRELLLSAGYNVGQIGTEPSSLLYGMDYCFPMGYNSSVYIKDFDIIRYLNYIVNDLCRSEKDIILVGSQSGTVPFDTGNIVQYTIPQQCFLLGTQPDAVILCVNPYDDLAYIKRTISFLESCVECKVIALVVFPMNVRGDWAGTFGLKKAMTNEEIENIKDRYESFFDIPTYNLGNAKDLCKVMTAIINYF